MSFCYIVCISLITCILLLFASNCYYKTILFKDTQEYFIKNAAGKKWNYLSFGSAYCRFGLDFNAAGYMDGRNLGYGSQFFYYTDKMLRQYGDLVPKGGYVFLICANLVFAEVGKGLYNADRYPLFLDRKSLGDEWSYWKYIKNVLFPCFFYPRNNLQVVKHVLRILLGYRSSYEQETNRMSMEQVRQAAAQRCKDWCNQFNLTDTHTDVITPALEETFLKTRALLMSMIQFCLDRELKPILVVTPISEHLNALLSERFLKKVLFDNIEKANVQHVPFLNYIDDPRFQDAKYYFNADMMNATGRKEFTRVLMEDVKRENI